jgi:MFS family permease
MLFLIGFYQRVAPAVMAAFLMSDFRLSGTALGNLSAFYFYSYTAMQVPTGLLADRWGPRRLLTAGCLVAGLGTLLFGLAPSLAWASLGRFLIGGSVAVAFVATLKLAGHWLAPRQFALATGLTLLVGIIGAVFAGVPLQLSIASYGWRAVMVASALLPAILGGLIWLVVRDDPKELGFRSRVQTISGPSGAAPGAIAGIRQVFRYRNGWLLSLIPGGIVGSILTFAGLWGVPFLMTHYRLPPSRAAALSTLLLVAWAIGGPILGGLSDRLGRRKPLYVACCIGLVGGWSIVIFGVQLPLWLLSLLLIGLGLASGCMIIGFAFIRESVPAHLSGTAIGLCNMGVMIGPMVLQPAVGWVLDRLWQGQLVDGVRIYDLSAYQAGFSLMVAWLVLALILVLFTKETYCRGQA